MRARFRAKAPSPPHNIVRDSIGDMNSDIVLQGVRPYLPFAVGNKSLRKGTSLEAFKGVEVA